MKNQYLTSILKANAFFQLVVFLFLERSVFILSFPTYISMVWPIIVGIGVCGIMVYSLSRMQPNIIVILIFFCQFINIITWFLILTGYPPNLERTIAGTGILSQLGQYFLITFNFSIYVPTILVWDGISVYIDRVKENTQKKGATDLTNILISASMIGVGTFTITNYNLVFMSLLIGQVVIGILCISESKRIFTSFKTLGIETPIGPLFGNIYGDKEQAKSITILNHVIDFCVLGLIFVFGLMILNIHYIQFNLLKSVGIGILCYNLFHFIINKVNPKESTQSIVRNTSVTLIVVIVTIGLMMFLKINGITFKNILFPLEVVGFLMGNIIQRIDLLWKKNEDLINPQTEVDELSKSPLIGIFLYSIFWLFTIIADGIGVVFYSGYFTDMDMYMWNIGIGFCTLSLILVALVKRLSPKKGK